MGKEAAEFELQLKAEWLAKMDDVRAEIERISLFAFRAIVNKSPVDTGRFRGNWNAAIGSPDFRTTENVDKQGAATIRRAAGAIGAYEAQQGFPPIHISNGLPYARRLEEGYSKQAPGGMVGLTVTEIQARFDGVDV